MKGKLMGCIYDITPFTLLDYPGEMACIVWISGCNMRCQFCHNPDIVASKGEIPDEELFDFLKKRVGRLTSVVFSGGEATLFDRLPDVMRRVRDMGFKIKLDTNGSRPKVIQALLEEALLDYVAMDYKAPSEKLKVVTGTSKYERSFQESLAFLVDAAAKQKVIFEVRTTVHTDLMDEDDVNWIIADLEKANYQGTYYVQNVISYGEKTIGNIDAQSRELDISKISNDLSFDVSFRNF